MKGIILVYFFISGIACNNSDKTKKEDSQINSADKIRSGEIVDNESAENQAYRWTEKEQNKFMIDCRREFKESVAEGRIKEICNCILTQARQYYKSYSQMDEKSNDDHDEEIITKCLGDYGEDEE